MAQAPSTDSERPSARDRKIEIFIGIVLIAIALAAIKVAFGFRSSGLATDVGPARFPVLYAGILIILCTILVISNAQALMRGDHASQAAPIAGRTIFLTIAGILLTIAAYLAMDTVGYAISMFVYLGLLMALLGMRHKLFNPVIAAAITGILYLAFDMALKVPLPVGSLFE